MQPNRASRIGGSLQNFSQMLMQLAQNQQEQKNWERQMAMKEREMNYAQNIDGLLAKQGPSPADYQTQKASPAMNQRSPYAGYGVMEMLQPQGAGSQAPVDPLAELKINEQELKNRKLQAEIEKLMAKGDSSPKWTPSPSLPTTTLNTILRESGGITGQDPNEMYQTAMKMVNPGSPQWDGVKRTSAPQGNPFAKQGQSTAQAFNNWDEYVAWRRGPGANDPDGPALDEYFKQRFGVK